MKKLTFVIDYNKEEHRNELYIDGIYGHGQLQEDSGYDIPIFTKNTYALQNAIKNRIDGIYSCIDEKSGKECNLFLWFVCQDNKYRNRGLIVYKTDLEAQKYAVLKMEIQSDRL
ncbi:MAG: hypothetical protein ACRC5M_05165 [Anaeroplasmataceae bacterium]